MEKTEAPRVGLRMIQNRKEVTIDDLKRLFPKKKNAITDKAVELINATINDPEFNGQDLVNTMSTYENVMHKNSADMEEYINAIRFCAYLESNGDKLVDAYKRTFIHREFVSSRMDAPYDSLEYKALTVAASRYRKNQLVVDILTMADVPLYLLFQGQRYTAVKVLADEMINAPLAKDRIAAADKLLLHVKPPETSKMELNIGIGQSAVDIQSSLNEQLTKLAMQQQALLAQGHDIREVQKLGINLKEQEIIEVEVDDGSTEG